MFLFFVFFANVVSFENQQRPIFAGLK